LVKLIAISGVAGSRKTQTSIELAEEMKDYEWVAFTFTNEMANSLMKRTNIKSMTFHSMCYRLIKPQESILEEWMLRHFYSKFGLRYIPMKLLDNPLDLPEGNRIHFIRRALLNTFIKEIRDVKANSVLEEIIKRKRQIWLPYSEERILKIIVEYENWKEKNMLIDFDDLLLRVIEEKPYPWFNAVVWDENQDASPLQIKAFLTISKRIEISIHNGDPAQTIYDDLLFSNPKYFLKIFDIAKKKIFLKYTYRIPKNIVPVVNRWFRRIKNRNIEAVYSKKEGGIVKKTNITQLFRFLKSMLKIPNIDFEFKGHEKRKFPAIITYSNSQIRRVSEELIFSGIPYKVRAGLSHPDWTIDMLGFRNFLWYYKNKIFNQRFYFYLKYLSKFNPTVYTKIYSVIHTLKFFTSEKLNLSWEDILNTSTLSFRKKQMVKNSVEKIPFEITNMVFLTTIHSAKGLTFDVVIPYDVPPSQVFENKDFMYRLKYVMYSRVSNALIVPL